MTTQAAANDGGGSKPVATPDEVSWTAMADGSRQDYEMLGELYESHSRETLVGNLLGVLRLLKGPKLGYQIDRFDHSLQSASRAMRADESVDLVVGALLHDIGDVLAPHNHSETAATIVAPYVDARTHWVVKHHGLFQGYYYFHHHNGDRHARDAYRDSPFYDDCIRFCAEFDQNCFDPDYPNLTVDDFLPAMHEVFSRPSAVPGVPIVPRPPDRS